MGCIQICVCCFRNRRLIISLLFLLISSLAHGRFTAEAGRPISKLVETSQKGREDVAAAAVVVVVRSLIGSRPPICERRCRSCGHCEAIQVPVVPSRRGYTISRQFPTNTVPKIADSRGEDISNYKPMCWKCKCGDQIFNP